MIFKNLCFRERLFTTTALRFSLVSKQEVTQVMRDLSSFCTFICPRFAKLTLKTHQISYY